MYELGGRGRDGVQEAGCVQHADYTGDYFEARGGHSEPEVEGRDALAAYVFAGVAV